MFPVSLWLEGWLQGCLWRRNLYVCLGRRAEFISDWFRLHFRQTANHHEKNIPKSAFSYPPLPAESFTELAVMIQEFSNRPGLVISPCDPSDSRENAKQANRCLQLRHFVIFFILSVLRFQWSGKVGSACGFYTDTKSASTTLWCYSYVTQRILLMSAQQHEMIWILVCSTWHVHVMSGVFFLFSIYFVHVSFSLLLCFTLVFGRCEYFRNLSSVVTLTQKQDRNRSLQGENHSFSFKAEGCTAIRKLTYNCVNP